MMTKREQIKKMIRETMTEQFIKMWGVQKYNEMNCEEKNAFFRMAFKDSLKVNKGLEKIIKTYKITAEDLFH